jgi:hypothetical protein
MGSQKRRIVGKSQPVLVTINSMIFIRIRRREEEEELPIDSHQHLSEGFGGAAVCGIDTACGAVRLGVEGSALIGEAPNAAPRSTDGRSTDGRSTDPLN